MKVIRFDTVTDKIAIDTEVWTGTGKIKISRGPAGVSIQYGEDALKGEVGTKIRTHNTSGETKSFVERIFQISLQG
jgi:hypothetical protein